MLIITRRGTLQHVNVWDWEYLSYRHCQMTIKLVALRLPGLAGYHAKMAAHCANLAHPNPTPCFPR